MRLTWQCAGRGVAFDPTGRISPVEATFISGTINVKIFTTAALAAVLLTPLPKPAHADDQVTAFYIELGREDFFNSRGTALRDVAAVIRQDRANFHRFGIRHPGDQSDRFFGNVGFRQAIPSLVNAGNLDSYLRGTIGAGWKGYNSGWLIQLCGASGQLTRMLIDPADGDGYSSC